MERIRALYRNHFGFEPASVEKFPASGSNRQYFRLVSPGGESVIGTIGEDPAENRAFVTISQEFCRKGLPVPDVLAVSDDLDCYLQRDLGSFSLFDAVAGGRRSGEYSSDERNLLVKTVSQLPALQFVGGRGLDYEVCYPQSTFDARTINFDLNYFKYCYLKLSGVPFNEILLQDDFDRLAEDLQSRGPMAFMYRDFQARNVMLVDGSPYFIDFQGGRRGPVYYDLASFIWQASARYPSDLKEELTGAYMAAASEYMEVEEAEFRDNLMIFSLFRTLQVLGAYGFRGYIEKKSHFIESIPPALKNVKELVGAGAVSRYPYLEKIMTQLAGSVPEKAQQPDDNGRLTVEVTSFSYRKGIPEDKSGNGGGFVFDCRALENPGRYAPYKAYNGLDANVIEFLEKDGGIVGFLDKVYALVDPQIEKYLERGFTHLMVSFGCTGGQHRSAYSAQHLAEHVAAKYDVDVIVRHTNLNIEQKLK